MLVGCSTAQKLKYITERNTFSPVLQNVINFTNLQGFWALCQNCHLGLEYMAELVNFFLEMEAPHPNFRVWITTEPHNDFPVSLLQISIKYTYEPPQGIYFYFLK